VEEAVLAEFDRITERGGVLGAMETMYQRSKIQEESLYYETLKHNGEYPIIGVNTFLSKDGSPTIIPTEVIRATEEEKVEHRYILSKMFKVQSNQMLQKPGSTCKKKAITNDNLFDI
jgi:methylmalonyl-CoA mutase